jgi:5-methylcytosine-specific restriction endonuclease McrA
VPFPVSQRFTTSCPEYAAFFARSGVLRRVHIPEWVKRAVYFRDRGRCVFCRQDLSGLVKIHSNKHYDHVVSLADGGLNDVTNIQLLCEGCNIKKSAGEPLTSDVYEAWYEINSGGAEGVAHGEY